MAVQRKGMTAKAFFRLPNDDTFQGLIRGEVHTSPPPGGPHGRTSSEIHTVLAPFVKAQELGAVFIETGYRVERNPDTVLAPDLSFVRAERLPALSEGGYSDLVPDLVVEVISPGESRPDVERRMREWLLLGARLGWAADPRRRWVAVYRPGAKTQLLGPEDVLDGGEVLPRFQCPIREFFP